ncbi:MAG: (deoxy)nucleoside triphosphate pyrophosphohydrolase [Rhodanobacter sp.]
MPTPQVIHVLAGVLLDAQGRVLFAQRPAGKHLAGQWEFPGGKRELGESPVQALARELVEELDIVVLSAEPLVAVPWHYGEWELLLDAWRVTRWDGTPKSAEGQALQWLRPGQMDVSTLAGADRLVLSTLLRAL